MTTDATQPQAVPDLVEELPVLFVLAQRVSNAWGALGSCLDEFDGMPDQLSYCSEHQDALDNTILTLTAYLGGEECAKFLSAITAAKAEVEGLLREGATLAAGQCIVKGGLLGDDHGNQYCAVVRDRDAALAELDMVRKPVTDEETRDILERLDYASKSKTFGSDDEASIVRVAHKIISRLSSRVEAAERALKPFADMPEPTLDDVQKGYGSQMFIDARWLADARAALQPKPQRP